jgi:probable HAF family extracellular repeat protein
MSTRSIVAAATPQPYRREDATMRSLLCAVAVLLTVTASTYGGQPETRIVVERIGSWDNAGQTFPIAINNRGQVVGSATNAAGRQGAFVWSRRDGFRIILDNAFATDINDHGDVVGIWIRCAPTPNGQHCDTLGFIWSERERFRDLGQFTPQAVNDRGDMAGQCQSSVGCVMRDGVLTSIPTSGETSLLFGINNRGDAVGYFLPAEEDAPTVAVLWRADGSVNLLGPGIAMDINNRGAVAGERFENDSVIATVWTKRHVFTAPIVGGARLDGIDSRGDAVGRYTLGAFVWNFHDDVFVPFGDPSTVPLDVNDRGVIVSWSNGPTGTEMFLWRARHGNE